MVMIMLNVQDKVDLQKTKINNTKIRKVCAESLRMDIDFVLGKNGGHRPSSLGSRSIVVISE